MIPACLDLNIPMSILVRVQDRRTIMAAQRDSILVQSPFIFNNVAEWDGIRVQHCRLHGGESLERWHTRHHIVVLLAGSFSSTMETATGRRTGWRSSINGHTPIIPAGQSYSTSWEEGLEDLSIHMDPALLARA